MEAEMQYGTGSNIDLMDVYLANKFGMLLLDLFAWGKGKEK